MYVGEPNHKVILEAVLILGDFLALIIWQHWFKQITHISCFVSMSNIFSLVYNLNINRLTNKQRFQIIEFYCQNACSVKKVHRALIFGSMNT